MLPGLRNPLEPLVSDNREQRSDERIQKAVCLPVFCHLFSVLCPLFFVTTGSRDKIDNDGF